MIVIKFVLPTFAPVSQIGVGIFLNYLIKKETEV